MAGAWRAAGWLAICLLRPGLGLAGVTQHTLTKLTPPLTSNEVNLGVCSQNSQICAHNGGAEFVQIMTGDDDFVWHLLGTWWAQTALAPFVVSRSA